MDEIKEPNFRDEDGNLYLVRCPSGGLENWAPAVASGICAWCNRGEAEKEEK